MVNKPFYRPMHIWVIILVIALHSLAVWAGLSMRLPQRPPKSSKLPNVIQLELLSSSKQNFDSAANSQSTSELKAKSKLHVNKTADSNTDEPIQSVQKPIITTKSSDTSSKSLANNKDFVKNKKQSKQPNLQEKSSSHLNTNDKSSNQSKDKNAANQDSLNSDADEVEDDLSAMIRAVTEQYNRDQAQQRRNLNNQSNRKLTEKDKWRQQAEIEAVNKLLALAAEQAKQQVDNDKLKADQLEQDRLNNKALRDNEAIHFEEDAAIWLDDHQPIADIPLIMWQNSKAHSGELLIVVLELHVDKVGYITEVQLLESSGDALIDTVATTQVRSGQLEPLQVNGEAVEAIVPKSVVYIRP